MAPPNIGTEPNEKPVRQGKAKDYKPLLSILGLILLFTLILAYIPEESPSEIEIIDYRLKEDDIYTTTNETTIIVSFNLKNNNRDNGSHIRIECSVYDGDEMVDSWTHEDHLFTTEEKDYAHRFGAEADHTYRVVTIVYKTYAEGEDKEKNKESDSIVTRKWKG